MHGKLWANNAMTKHHLPAGCHDAESAAQLLGMSKRALLQKLREMGWLNVGGDAHNLPRRELTTRGWLCTQQRGYCLKGKKEIAKSYTVMLLTQAGFAALKNELEKEKMNTQKTTQQTTGAHHTAPKHQQYAPTREQETVIPFNRETADEERKKALEQLKDWGLAS